MEGQDGGDVAVTGRFYRDGDEYIGNQLRANEDQVAEVFRRNDAGDLYDEYGVDAIKHLDEADSPSNIRGQIGEAVLQPELQTRKYGSGSFDYDAESGSATLESGYIPDDDIPFEMDSQKQGFDGFAIDNDGNLVVIETKTTNSNGRVTNTGAFGDTLSRRPVRPRALLRLPVGPPTTSR